MIRPNIPSLLRGAGLALTISWTIPASAQDTDLGIDRSLLEIAQAADCIALRPVLEGEENGAQWLIGDGIPLFGLAEGRSPLGTINGAFAQVNCYSESSVSGRSRVFVATGDLQSCGWIPRTALLDEHRREKLDAFSRKRRPICEAARAMPLKQFCDELAQISTTGQLDCEGIPPGLRAKGVLLGSTAERKQGDVVFRSSARGGSELEERTFFSVLEIHDIDANESGAPVVLVGDGEGEMFGWVEWRHLELWPTRLGLFYDAEGQGFLFSEEEDLLLNWRTGSPEPNIRPGLPKEDLADYVHGGSQLLSYPIIRTIDPLKDPLADPSDPAYHEVIFLGQSGDGSASDLLSQAEIAQRVDALQKLNVMIVVDTTESMRPYLPLIRNGISQFINKYRADRRNPALRLPDLRLAVFAYSDFKSPNATGLNDPIDIVPLMLPRGIDEGSDLAASLRTITTHTGVDDSVGLREEAAFEAVVQLSRNFNASNAWFEDGPRFIIHIADHGSRNKIDLAQVRVELARSTTKYVPLAVITEDASENAKAARLAMLRQATATMQTFQSNPTAASVARIDLLDFQNKTPLWVQEGLDFVKLAIIDSVKEVRGGSTSGLSARDEVTVGSSEFVRERAASRIELSQRLLEEYGLDNVAQEVILQADTGYAPLVIRPRGLEQPVDWTYTVALDPEQASVLATELDRLCGLVGSPEQRAEFRALIIRLAQAFSGDEVVDEADLRAILGDIGELPGADHSFLALPPRVLLEMADSTDRDVVSKLRRDVCWISYHLTNMRSEVYAQPAQLLWTGREYALKDAEEITRRVYRYQPVIGAETVFLPSFFFVAPSIVEESDRFIDGGSFFDK